MESLYLVLFTMCLISIGLWTGIYFLLKKFSKKWLKRPFRKRDFFLFFCFVALCGGLRGTAGPYLTTKEAFEIGFGAAMLLSIPVLLWKAFRFLLERSEVWQEELRFRRLQKDMKKNWHRYV